MADAIEQMAAEIKKLRKKIDEMEEAGKSVAAQEERLKALEDRLAKTDPDFSNWD